MSRMNGMCELARFYAMYAARSVFRDGIGRNGYVRAGLLLIAVSWLAFSSVAPFLLFRGAGLSARDVGLVEVLLSFNTLVWIQLGFLLVKTVFLTADGIVELTVSLPVTNRQRSQALVLFEVAAMLVIVVYSTFGLSLWAVSRLGFSGIRATVFSVFLPGLLGYGVLSLGWNAVVAIMRLTPFRRIAPALANLMLTIPFYATISGAEAMQGVVLAVYEGKDRGVHWATFIADLAAGHNDAVVALEAVAAIVILISLSFALAPARPPRTSAFLGLPLPGFVSPGIAVHISFVLRSRYTWDAAVISILLGFWLAANHLPPFAAAGLPSFVGLYLYGAGQVNAWVLLARPSVLARYGLLVSSLGVACLVLAIPFLVLGVLFAAVTLHDVFVACASAVIGSVVFTLLGVLFPSRRDNPFSAMAGLGSLTLVALFLVVAGNVLGLDDGLVPLVSALLLAAIAAVSVAAISYSQRKERHAFQ